MWFKHKIRNRRTARGQDVLDVKLRSSRLRAGRTRLASIALGVCFGTILGLYCLWQAGGWALDRLIYDNKSFAIRQIDVVSDGVISTDQLRRWSGVKTGDNLLALDLAGVKRNLELVPMIESASVERILPGTLRIQITERVPVAEARVPPTARRRRNRSHHFRNRFAGMRDVSARSPATLRSAGPGR